MTNESQGTDVAVNWPNRGILQALSANSVKIKLSDVSPLKAQTKDLLKLTFSKVRELSSVKKYDFVGIGWSIFSENVMDSNSSFDSSFGYSGHANSPLNTEIFWLHTCPLTLIL